MTTHQCTICYEPYEHRDGQYGLPCIDRHPCCPKCVARYHRHLLRTALDGGDGHDGAMEFLTRDDSLLCRCPVCRTRMDLYYEDWALSITGPIRRRRWTRGELSVSLRLLRCYIDLRVRCDQAGIDYHQASEMNYFERFRDGGCSEEELTEAHTAITAIITRAANATIDWLVAYAYTEEEGGDRDTDADRQHSVGAGAITDAVAPFLFSASLRGWSPLRPGEVAKALLWNGGAHTIRDLQTAHEHVLALSASLRGRGGITQPPGGGAPHASISSSASSSDTVW